ncbi:EAL domain-containing protein [Neobacillus sedimentimangrovi]|jgi:diguanylate cyclase (GGDEF)-like protein/PAS domain S-box-containing protein|uniref:EAL domain-containing protein n=2 Tax=Neobacillus sedimentimangrovi TaxID=2699460 RepID=A0ABS8QLK6_9BACI|nr:EAL domain-containing protein [Neobacillus sedimentimangrovi]
MRILLLEDEQMKQYNHFLTIELESGKAGPKIQKIIFEIIFQHIQDMVFVMKVEEGPKFRYLFINETGMKKANLSIEAIGKTFEEALSTEAAFFLQKMYEKLLNTKEVVIFNDRFVNEGGNEVYGETILTPIFDNEHSIRYIIAITRDITERTMKKKKIMESEQRYRSIVDHNLDAIFTLSTSGKIMEANPAAERLTGYTEKEMTIRSIYDMIDDRDLEKFRQLLDKTCSGYALENMDCKLIHRKGHLLIVHIKTVPIIVNEEIKGLYVIFKDLSEQAKNMEMIKFMAFHDQLTGLLNRRALLEHLNERIYVDANNSFEFALFSIDLDRFKYLNDSLGHLAGDEILKKVSSRLLQFQNDNCFVYRVGGDEFTILLLHTNRSEASHFASKIFSLFSQSFYLNSHEYFISPSIGISMFPNDGKDPETLIKNADEALFRVKEKGRAHYQFYCTDMNSVITNVVTLETHLRKAIEKNELVLYYQPQIDCETGEAKCFEALLRWKDHEFGHISPDVFIPLAEDTGMIISIGNWVIESVCKQIKTWNEKGIDDIRIAINISPKQMNQPNFVPFIQLMIEKYNLNPSSLEIEITEGVMHDTREVVPILFKLKQLGIYISVDDFGTGFSSLNYLKRFPIDGLKIDQSFIKEILSDEKDAAITTTIIHLGKSLGLEVIAEGVEEKEQVSFLRNVGCHKIQGYYFSKPIPVDELEKMFLCSSPMKKILI